MNLFLWLGVLSTAVLLVSLLVDAADGVLDVDLGDGFGADWLSLPVLAAFTGAFGFVTGALLSPLGPAAPAAGVAAGLVFGFATVRLSRAAQHMPTDATEREADLLAATGRVVVAPAPGRYGEVLLDRPTGPVKVAAAAEAAIARGTPVVVVHVRSSTLVVVEPFDDGLT